MRLIFGIVAASLALVGFTNFADEAFTSHGNNTIRWMEFDIPVEGLKQALEYDIKSEGGIGWIDLLAYTVAKNWGKYPKNDRNDDIDVAATRLAQGESIEDLASGLRLFPFYRRAYGAVLEGMVGEYELETDQGWERKYGVKAFFPLAAGNSFSHFDDFGNSRSYGYRRRHLGHDLMARTGVPVIAVEDGYVEALGWNRYGGWRIGIRTTDKKRYYYYAHLRKDHPFHKSLAEGVFVRAGDVIGYVGMTGYSTEENVNNISAPHLHLGLQIIFDESQKDGNNQIWVDLYDITKLLYANKMTTQKDSSTGDHIRTRNTNSVVTD